MEIFIFYIGIDIALKIDGFILVIELWIVQGWYVFGVIL